MFSAPITDKDPSIHNLAKDGAHGAGRAVRASPLCLEGCEKVRSEKTCRGLEKSSCDCGQEGGGGVVVWAAGEEAEIKGEESAKSQ